MSKKDKIINTFKSSTFVGQNNITKNDVYLQNGSDPSIGRGNVGWAVDSMVKSGIIELDHVGKRKVNYYKRIK